MWPFHRHWVFQPPPCICNEIEAQVRAACAVRDDMATWPTPLEAWKKLQEMPVLQPKAEPKPVVDVWDDYYRQFVGSTYISTATVMGRPQPFQYLPPAPRAYESCLKLLPGESYEVGTILKRGDTRYKITERLFDNTNRVKVKKIR